MSKSFKLKNNIFLDTKSIVHNKKLFSSKFEENTLNVGIMNQKKWVKICNIKFDYHIQGAFAFMKIFIGWGNNGLATQNAYIDLIMQLSWVGDYGGRFGCIAELHPLLSSFSTSNIQIKILSNSNTDYDIWFYTPAHLYCNPNYIAHVCNKVSVTPKWELSDTEPIGTECNLSFISV